LVFPSRPGKTLVSVEHLHKSFCKVRALDDLSFEVKEGEIVGLVGPNGAGKTTAIHVILGLISPDRGRVTLFGDTLDANREQILARLNFTSPYMAFPARLSVRENLDIFARLYNLREAKKRISYLLERFGMAHLRDTPIARLSSGETTRVGLCKAFLNDPDLLLLDEPTTYLDPQAALQVKEALRELQRDRIRTILFTSHDMREVQQTCQQVIFLNRGRVIASGNPIEVTRALLREHREAPALDEAFIHVARRTREAASN
jgi:ABC-2 type transport system ATP-binding protein